MVVSGVGSGVGDKARLVIDAWEEIGGISTAGWLQAEKRQMHAKVNKRCFMVSPMGSYALQAAIAACHARALAAEDTDWQRISALYDALSQLTPSPVVELNRAVALSMAFGPATGLEVVDALTHEPSLKNYHLLPSVRGDFLAKLGRFDEAAAEFNRAASMTQNARERELLLDRAESCAQGRLPER